MNTWLIGMSVDVDDVEMMVNLSSVRLTWRMPKQDSGNGADLVASVKPGG
jgi:hypothetical protein